MPRALTCLSVYVLCDERPGTASAATKLPFSMKSRSVPSADDGGGGEAVGGVAAGNPRAKRKRKMAPQLLRVPKFRRPSITKRKRKRSSVVEQNVRCYCPVALFLIFVPKPVGRQRSYVRRSVNSSRTLCFSTMILFSPTTYVAGQR